MPETLRLTVEEGRLGEAMGARELIERIARRICDAGRAETRARGTRRAVWARAIDFFGDRSGHNSIRRGLPGAGPLSTSLVNLASNAILAQERYPSAGTLS